MLAQKKGNCRRQRSRAGTTGLKQRLAAGQALHDLPNQSEDNEHKCVPSWQGARLFEFDRWAKCLVGLARVRQLGEPGRQLRMPCCEAQQCSSTSQGMCCSSTRDSSAVPACCHKAGRPRRRRRRVLTDPPLPWFTALRMRQRDNWAKGTTAYHTL